MLFVIPIFSLKTICIKFGSSQNFTQILQEIAMAFTYWVYYNKSRRTFFVCE